MKKLLLFFSFLLMTVAIMAQSSPFISYQAVVRDGQNRLVTNEAISVTIQILNSSDVELYAETDGVTSNANGLISLTVGDNDPTHFSTINWEGAKFKTTVKVVSTSYEVTSITPVTAAPLALHAIYASDVNPAGSTVQAIYNKIQGDSLVLADRIQNDSLILANRIQNDSLTLANKIQNDSLILANRIKSDSTALHNALIDTANNIRNSIGDGILSITYGTNTPVTFTANQHTNSSITIPAPTSANDATITIKKNSVEVNHFTLNQSTDQDIDIIVPTKVTDLEDNANYVTKTFLNDTLDQYYTKTETYTQAEVNALLGTTDAGVNTLRDSVKTNITNIANLQDRVNTFNTHVCDSVMACDGIQTMQNNISTNASNIATNASAITGLQTKAHNDSLTLANRIQNDSLTLANRIQNDSLTLANRIQNDSLTLVNRIKSDSTVLHNALIDTAANIRGALVDSANAIRNSIGNGTLTITYGTETPVTFTANQNTNSSIAIPAPTSANDAEITITSSTATITNGSFTLNQSGNQNIGIEVPTKLSEMVNDGGHYAKRDSVNVFTEANDFTNKITVPSKFDIHNPTPCTQDAVNICDLVAVFDSLMRRIDSISQVLAETQQKLDDLQPSLTVTASDATVTVCSGTSKAVTYTATFHNCSSSDYTILWKVNGTDSANVTGQTLTLNAENAGDHKVVCIATRSDNTSVKDSVTTTVVVDMNVPSFTATTNALTVSLSNIVNTDMLQWDTDSLPVVFDASSTTAEHIYSVADTITITATSANGCTFVMGLRLQAIAPTVTTDSIPTSTITANTAKAFGTVTSDGGKPNTRRGMVYSTTASTEVALVLDAPGVDSVKAAGTGKGSYSCDLTKLVPCTQYYVRAYAINDVDTAYGDVMNFTTKPFTCGSTLTDIDGNEYGTLQLGSQCWMQQNLRTTHFADGTEIPLGGSGNHSGARRYAPDSNLDTYGYLYNWDAAMNGSASSEANPSGVQGVCPDGWHLPSDAEWTQLTSFVASNSDNVCDNNPSYIAKSLVSTEDWGAGAWSACSSVTTNNTGFSVLPAGTWHVNGAAGHTGQGYYDGHAIFRTATLLDEGHVHARELYTENAYVDATAIDKTNGLSVRCVLTCPTESAYLPTVSTVTLSASGATVSMTSNVLSDGGDAVTERGVCWSTSQNPTISSDHTADSGTGTGAFMVSGSLTPGNTYYVRAYATNSKGTAYGAEVTYVAPIPATPPTVNTGSQFLALNEGFEGSTLPSTWTTIDNDNDGYNWYQLSYMPHNGEGCATSESWYQGTALTPDNYLITPDITLPSGISPILTFWFRGMDDISYYAREHFEVKVGNAGASTVGDFTTQVFDTISSNEYAQKTINLSSYAGQTIRLAFVHNNVTDKSQLLIDDIVFGEAGADATAVVSDITATTATCGGYVADDGGATVTARGVCWSTSQNPTVSDSHTTDGNGTGSFTSNITGLNALTTYYVRAYATNSEGTTYGNQVSFTTPEALPKVTTSVVSDVTIDNTTLSATCGGNVTDIGAYAVTARGVCWGTSTNPTISDSHTTDGSGLGSFTSNITGLTGGTYYVRAYATNSAGTAYGNQVSFTLPTVDAKSCSSAPVATDHEGNMYATVQIGTQCWMRENLRTTTSPKTGTKLALPARNSAGNVYSSLGSKVAHWYMNDSTTYAPKGYGLLYNWCAAMDTASPTTATATYMEVPTPSNINGNNTSYAFNLSDPHRGICPAGWHVPSNQDWNNLKTTISEAGKLAGGNDWESSSNATAPGNYDYADRNDSKFTALPVGKFNNYNCDRATTYAYFWCSMQMDDPTNARCLYMTHSGNTSTISYDGVSQGMSVRCVKD